MKKEIEWGISLARNTNDLTGGFNSRAEAEVEAKRIGYDYVVKSLCYCDESDEIVDVDHTFLPVTGSSVNRILLLCAATTPMVIGTAGLILYNGFPKLAGTVLFVAGVVDLLGYSTAIFERAQSVSDMEG